MRQRGARAALLCSTPGCRTVTVIRRVGKQKKAGHIKPLWCYKCKARTAHIELGASEKRRQDRIQAAFAEIRRRHRRPRQDDWLYGRASSSG